MGTWSHEPFGNDSANDWAYQLEQSQDFSLVESALTRVVESDGYLDADLGVEAVAAAEVLARMVGRGTRTDAHTDTVDAWVAMVAVAPPQRLFELAQQALARILAPGSELRELWQESDAFEQWETSMLALQSAVAA